MPTRAHRHDASGAGRGKRIVQPKRKREMPEMICRELHFVAARRQRQLLNGHHAGVVDQDVKRSGPRRDEGADAGQVAEIQCADGDSAVAGALADLGGHLLTRLRVPDGERDRGTGVCKCTRGLDADTRRCAGDDGPLTGQIDAGDDLCGG